MGTKNNPGKFDCYANAEPDEPMFVLLGRDRHAPALVTIWAALRAAEGENLSTIIEAMDCATDMLRYCEASHRGALEPVALLKTIARHALSCANAMKAAAHE